MSFDKKAYMVAYNKAYREKNRQKAKEYSAKRWLEKREQLKAVSKRWYQSRSPEVIERRRQARRLWAINNPEKIKASMRKAYLKNPTKYKLNSKKWQKEHPEVGRQICTKRRAIKLKATIGNEKEMLEWMRRWKSLSSVRCYWCENFFDPKECSQDHIVALSKGGEHSISNLCVSCKRCNSSKNNLPIPVWNLRIQNPTLNF